MSTVPMISALILLLVGGYFTVKFKMFYILHPKRTLSLVSKDGITQMLLSLGGTVGVGNISGVAVAIMMGGSGAVLWMWVGAFFAMALKYAEITLGMIERKGAKRYIAAALGSIASWIFAALLIIDCIMMGAAIQANAISEAMCEAFGISPLLCGILLCVLTSAVFTFKLDLFRLSGYIVPLMSVGYALAALFVIALNITAVPKVIADIFHSAFTFDSAVGGVFGFLFTPAFKQGIIKGLFSNEAGCGTAPLAHAEAKETVPARQGLFGVFEVAVDTVVMCTLTALVILLTLGDENLGASGGVAVCVTAFSKIFGNFAAYVLCIFVFLFAFSAIVSFGYYGIKSISLMTAKESAVNIFLTVYFAAVFVGCTSAPMMIWTLADYVICIMLIINTTAVFIMRKKVLSEHARLYTQIGKYSQSASKTRDFSCGRIKNEIPMSQIDIKDGFTR